MNKLILTMFTFSYSICFAMDSLKTESEKLVFEILKNPTTFEEMMEQLRDGQTDTEFFESLPDFFDDLPPLFVALFKHDFKQFKQLLLDPKTDINVTFDGLSLLYHVHYHLTDHEDDYYYGLREEYDRKEDCRSEMFDLLLRRADLQIDQKGKGSGDYGDTMLGAAVISYFNSHDKENEDLSYINRLLQKGAQFENMSDDVQKRCYDKHKIKNTDQLQQYFQSLRLQSLCLEKKDKQKIKLQYPFECSAAHMFSNKYKHLVPDQQETLKIKYHNGYDPPIFMAMWNNNFIDVCKLIRDLVTDINDMSDDRSLLHFVYYRCMREPKYNFIFDAMLRRSDLCIDKKGSGIEDQSNTVLGVAFVSMFHKLESDKQPDVKQSMRVIKKLLQHGARIENMDRETYEKVKKKWEVSTTQEVKEMLHLL